MISRVVKKAGSPTTIYLEHKGFHQFSLCQYLAVNPFRVAQLGFMSYFESGVFPKNKTNAENKKQPILFVAAKHGQARVVEWLSG